MTANLNMAGDQETGLGRAFVVVIENDETTVKREWDDGIRIHPGSVSVDHEVGVNPCVVGMLTDALGKVRWRIAAGG